MAGPWRSTIETPASSAGRSESGRIGLAGEGSETWVSTIRASAFRNHDATKPEATAAFQMRCSWIASHQQETRQLGWRRPGSNASLRFVVDQMLAVERISPIRRERGGHRTLVVVDKSRTTLWARETPSEKLTSSYRLGPIRIRVARQFAQNCVGFAAISRRDFGKIFERLIRRTLATSVLNLEATRDAWPSFNCRSTARSDDMSLTQW